MIDRNKLEAETRREIRLAAIVIVLIALAAVTACVAIGIAIAPYMPPQSAQVLGLIPVVLAFVVLVLLRS